MSKHHKQTKRVKRNETIDQEGAHQAKAILDAEADDEYLNLDLGDVVAPEKSSVSLGSSSHRTTVVVKNDPEAITKFVNHAEKFVSGLGSARLGIMRTVRRCEGDEAMQHFSSKLTGAPAAIDSIKSNWESILLETDFKLTPLSDMKKKLNGDTKMVNGWLSLVKAAA